VSEVGDLVMFLRGCGADNGLADRPFDIVIGGTSPAGPAGRDLASHLELHQPGNTQRYNLRSGSQAVEYRATAHPTIP
jgi:hypothetical protein